MSAKDNRLIILLNLLRSTYWEWNRRPKSNAHERSQRAQESVNEKDKIRKMPKGTFCSRCRQE